MGYREMVMDKRKRVALVAHDNKKQELLDWARFNERLLSLRFNCAGSEGCKKLSVSA